ncbi:hypothetical protein L6452_18611 [Arctium lappa]|uniref:Uncharacterized protein n=1 Tax=Arctium lappa TaxID=4217 RepID=A0ACB9C6Q3_ARCLA|nr:hypothetical protein L6452_18611 [Arctium lappa]
MKKVEKKRKDFEKDNVELKKKISELEDQMKKEKKERVDFEKERKAYAQKDKFEKEKKKAEQKNVGVFKEISEQRKNVEKDFEEGRKVFEERNNLSSKIKEIEEIMFKVNVTEQKTPESIVQSPRDDLAESECSFKTASSSRFTNVSNNPLFDSDDSHTSKSKDQIRPSNLFYDKHVDGSCNIKKNKSQQKMFWRRKDEKEKDKWICKVKGSSEEKKEQKSFVYTSKAKRNNAPKGKTFGKPDLVYTINQLIRHLKIKGRRTLTSRQSSLGLVPQRSNDGL